MSAYFNETEQSIKALRVKKRDSVNSSSLSEVGQMSREQRPILCTLQAWSSFKHKFKSRSVLPSLIELESTRKIQTEISAPKSEVLLPSLTDSNKKPFVFLLVHI